MQLAFLLAILLTVAVAEHAPREAATSVVWSSLIAAGCELAAIVGIAVVSRWRMRRRRTVRASCKDCGGAEGVERWCDALQIACWYAGLLGALLFGRWPQLVRVHGGCGDLILIDDLAILAAAIVPLLAIWSTRYDEQRQAADESAAEFLGRFAYLRASGQLVLGLTLASLLGVLAARDLAERPGGSSAWSFAGGLPILVGVVATFPLAVRKMWRTDSLLDGPLRRSLLEICREQRLAVRDILLWSTYRFSMNAAVLGLTPWNRYVLLTDGLVARLDDDEIAAVFRHELAHVRRRHLPQRLLLIGVPLFATTIGQWARPDWFASWAPDDASGESLGLKLAFTGAVFAYLTVSLGWLARLQEHDADLWACRMVTDEGTDRQADAKLFARALERLVGRDPAARRRGTWLHPSIERRIDLLHGAAVDPRIAIGFATRMRRIGWSLVGLYLAIGLLGCCFWAAGQKSEARLVETTGISAPD